MCALGSLYCEPERIQVRSYPVEVSKMQRGAGIRPLGQMEFRPVAHPRIRCLYINHHILLLHRDRHGLRQRPLHNTLTLGHLHRIAAHLECSGLQFRGFRRGENFDL